MPPWSCPSFLTSVSVIWVLISQAFSGQWWAFRVSALKEHTRNQAPGPHPPTGFRGPNRRHLPLLKSRSPLCSPYPQLSLAMVLNGERRTLRLGVRARELGGPSGWRAGPTRAREPETGGHGRHPQGALEWGVRAQQPEGFPKGTSCILGSRHSRRDSSGNDSPKQELLARGEDLDWEMQGALMEVAVVITQAQTSMLIAVITTT